jgi:23S rRNA (cytosine1962-C5)-methyltransferase
MNGLSQRVKVLKEDAADALGKASRDGGFDLVLCDPPKLAPARSNAANALRHYRGLARAACLATRPGGLLFYSSCSGAISSADLARAVALGARDANLTATILEQHVQAPDHPVPASFPEGLYLKSLIVRVDKVR